MDDLTVGADLSFIRRDRGKRRGGGVAICYNPTKMRLSRFPVPQNEGRKLEIVCATGNTSITKRKIALVAVYMPPSIDARVLDLHLHIG